MNFSGVIIGFVTFLLIGVGHVIVIKGEYYFGTKLWFAFLIFGMASLAGSLFAESHRLSGILGIAAFVFLWSIKEIFEREERVRKGWFPENPNRQKENS